jgi:conjugative transfer pilus assembly protein TraH
MLRNEMVVVINMNINALIKKTVGSAIIAAGISLTSLSYAGGIEEEMERMFGSMTSVTDPQVTMTRRRGMISGGSISVRHPVVRETLIDFRPPSISAGCQGIDVFSGSFSYLQSDRLVALARATIANAKGYFFSLALRSACPTCENIMNELADKVNAWNQQIADSCTMGRALVDNVIGFEENTTPTVIDNALKGFVDAIPGDNFSAWYAPDSAQRTLESPDAREKLDELGLRGNLVWRLLAEYDAGKNFVGNESDADFYQDVMSVTGTVWINPNPDEQGGINDSQTFESELTLKILVEGQEEGIDASGETSTGPLKVIRCEEGTANIISESSDREPGEVCPPVVVDYEGEFEGLSQKLKRVLIGAPTIDDCQQDPNSCQGLLTLYNNPALSGGALSDEFISIINTLPATYHTKLRDLAIHDLGAAQDFVDKTIDLIAYEIVMDWMREIRNTLVLTLAQTQWKTSPAMLERLDNQISSAETVIKERQAEVSQTTSVYDLYRSYRFLAPDDNVDIGEQRREPLVNGTRAD